MYPIPNMGHRFFVNKNMIIEQTIATVPTITVYISVPLSFFECFQIVIKYICPMRQRRNAFESSFEFALLSFSMNEHRLHSLNPSANGLFKLLILCRTETA